jgi:hypothetical protein
MTELTACMIALMLTIESGVAIACAAAWLTWRQSDPSDKHNPAPLAAPLGRRRADDPVLLGLPQDLREIQPLICI